MTTIVTNTLCERTGLLTYLCFKVKLKVSFFVSKMIYQVIYNSYIYHRNPNIAKSLTYVYLYFCSILNKNLVRENVT